MIWAPLPNIDPTVMLDDYREHNEISEELCQNQIAMANKIDFKESEFLPEKDNFFKE